MYGALLLFESEFVHIVAISFTSLILTELLMVALTIQTWHWLMTVAELLSLACYIASLVFLHEFIAKQVLKVLVNSVDLGAPATPRIMVADEVDGLAVELLFSLGTHGALNRDGFGTSGPGVILKV
ncbi:hypothetical protein P7K49_009914 [Saguinus oedipus]|uniref:Uncharacterized protein n=1 Tax=Saguinus oedipus TaxID=9490 RepID=A0ABQ9VNL9_SAGOE|nr:hypothetical protein P7K49_009914 [Saguinus oedipus]